jgi:predicted RNA-binding Zn-ribbon protein involved in translation (DUF1610 family)
MEINEQKTFKMKLYTTKPIGVTIFHRDNTPKPKNLEAFVMGDGPYVYLCGKCDHVLLRNVHMSQVTKAIYKCPKCGAYNQII